MSELEEIKELENKVKELEKSNKYLLDQICLYEQDGVAKLFYALNRKSSEMADLLNKQNLKDVPLDDPKDKTFERLKIIWNDAASLSAAIKELGLNAGVTGDESKDIKSIVKKPFTPEMAADQVGELAGQNKG